MKLCRTVLLLAAGLCLCAHCGCNRVDVDSSTVVFSPDGKQVGYVWARQWKWAETDEGYMIGKNTELVGYGPIESPRSNYIKEYRKSTRVPDYLSKLTVKQLAFSPDSEKLAIVREDAIDIVNFNDNKVNQLTLKDEIMGSLVWLNNDEVVYTAIVPDNDPRKKKNKDNPWPATFKAVYRQYFCAPQGKRVELYRDLTTVMDQPAFEEYWSPDSKTVLLAGQIMLKLLDLETGKFTESILERYGEIRGVAWKPDSSEVFIGFGWSWDKKGKSGAIKVNRKTGKVTDYGKYIRQAFGTEPFRILDWTKDGKYIIAWGVMTQTCLFNLDPWKILWFEDDFSESLPRFESEYRIIRALKPGWLWMKTHNESKTYAVDYYGRFIIPIAERKWAVNKDATLIAEVPTKYLIQVRKLTLPELPPPPKPTEKQKYWVLPDTEIEGALEEERTQRLLDELEGLPVPESQPVTQPAEKTPAEPVQPEHKTPETPAAPPSQPEEKPQDKENQPQLPPEMRPGIPHLQEIRTPKPGEDEENDDLPPAREPMEV